MKNNPKTDRRIKRSKIALKKSLFSLMEEKDLKSISITEITERADCNRGTFYSHYESKENLLEEIVQEKMEDLIKALVDSYPNDKDILFEEMSSAAMALFTHFWNNVYYYQLMLNKHVYSGFQEYLCETINNHFLKNLRAVRVNPNHNINHEINSYYTAYSILGMLVYWFKNDLVYTPQYMANQLMNILTNHPYKVNVIGSEKDTLVIQKINQHI
ncbi:TetR/AcrR family transcriptional regulator [Bacillus nitratireducens]|uniref:TetR/AcrR family transcriptional regulator n=1 Tax=Bacillus nitratireducens TaxID=2026193 RepID=UPI000BED0191|nr:TetR/AcrR family transcriptional regulator [Bacillus nitratireducens]PEE16251.1 hypothetical protein CON53_20110 [Bacillus cereus]MED0906267.1 TetR/AcrR family transcriptional regulator [Bacillus nitratireducens]PFH94848.1 hypothetical protein COI81_00050 [Bacillus cereus]PFM49218.1 hypothetical protein COJ52_28210 [Bacillus cereus]PGS30017.1 hypothetical protein COC55_04310 [Bacillus cereus]